MPRKAAATTDGAEPRRSSRIKDLPKPDLPKKAPAKPRVKKADGEAPKRGKKRAAEEPNGAEPAAKKTKPASKAASKPTSKAAAKPASKASAKPVSKASVKPASRAGSKKPVSKAEAGDKGESAQVPETIAEETEEAA